VGAQLPLGAQPAHSWLSRVLAMNVNFRYLFHACVYRLQRHH